MTGSMTIELRGLFGKTPPISKTLLLLAFVLLLSERCELGNRIQATFVDSSKLKPSIILISPQSFKVPLSSIQDDENSEPIATQQQFVALINDIKNERDDQALREQYKKLTLQVRDAESPITGQLFFEHIFDYFPPNATHLLVPINLDQVSPSTQANAARTFADVVPSQDQTAPTVGRAQKLIVSVRPYQLESGFGSDSIEFVSSAPVPVESVPSIDGRRSFAIVQTDKPIYKPEDKVKIRAMVVNENLRPTIKEELRLQIKNPQKLIVEEVRFPRPINVSDNLTIRNQNKNYQQQNMFLDHVFEFPPEPMLGTWTVQLLHDDPISNDTILFEVKEYQLPPFEIQFDLPRYILPSTQQITGAINVKYHHGRPVRGTAQFKFGFRQSLETKTKFIARSSMKNIDPITGRVDFKISSEKFKDHDWFPSIAGSKLIIDATVNEIGTGHEEIAQDNSCVFLTSPYRFVFEDTIDDFKPDLTQQLTVRVVEAQTNRPLGAGERIVAQYRDQNRTILNSSPLLSSEQPVDFRRGLDFEAITDSNGRATFNIGPIRNDTSFIDITFKALNSTTLRDILPSTGQVASGDIPNIRSSELATGTHRILRHESKNGYILFMNKTVTQLNVGDQFVSDLLIRDALIGPQRIYYLVVSRGRIISLDTLNSDGLVSFQITDSMLPAIRVVLFALTQDSIGYLSDSMKISIGEDLSCGMKLRYKSNSVQNPNFPPYSYRPNDAGKIAIQARQHDLVSLIGVDSAVYSINNRPHLESSRIINRIKRLDPGCGFGGGRNNLDVFHNAGLLFFKESSPAVSSSESQLGSSCESISSQLRILEDIQMGYVRSQFMNWAQKQKLPSLELSSLIRTPYRAMSSSFTNLKHRHKREIKIESILNRYKDPMHKSCCRLGTLEDIPQRRNCSIRTKIVEKYMHQVEFKSCSAIYLDCCRAVFGDPLLMGSMFWHANEQVVTARVAPTLQAPQYTEAVMALDISQLDRIEDETLTRTDFRETWLFELVNIDSADGSGSLEVKLPHTITSWTVTAIALNRFQPICLTPKPLRLTTFQEIFVQISMPYKVIQGEQIDLVASIFNYSPRDQAVFVYMYGLEDVCSEAEAGERSERKRILIEKSSSQSVIFPMIPLKVGKYSIKILAVTLSSNQSDIIERELNVVPKGKPVIDETTFSLDPMNHQRRSKRAIQTRNLVDEIDSSKALQRSRVRLTPTRDSEFIVPQTQECIVSAIGDKMGQSLQTTLLDVENLIRLPHGCGEQVMIYLGPTLYTARYLSTINKLTGDLRWRAIRYIQSGYKRVLNFRREEGGFSAFPRRDPSIWLTAFIVKMLCQTEKTEFIADEIHVDRIVVNSALSWLVDQQDNETGTWTELNPVYHREMLGGVLKENALTSFVVVTLNECSHHSPDVVEETEIEKMADGSTMNYHTRFQTNGIDKLKVATQKAERALFLDRYKAVKERNPYVLALTAYALTFSRPNDAAAVLNDLMLFSDRSQSRNHLYWRGDYPIETAAYALQALIELAPILDPSNNGVGPTSGPKSVWSPGADSVAISNWLSTRRSYTGAFESTQDTIVALEALSKLAQIQSSPSTNTWFPAPTKSPSLICNVTINNRTRRSIEFGSDNAQILQSFKLDSFEIDPSMDEMLDIVTQGNGLGTMSVKVKYNVFHDDDDLCRFNIDSWIEEWHPKIELKEDGVTPVRVDDQTDDKTISDFYFKKFDKAMLTELNLINPNQSPKTKVPKDTSEPTAEQLTRRHPVLRMRRYAPIVNNPSQAERENDSWTSKVLTSVKSKLPSWLVSGKPTTTTLAPSRLGSHEARHLDMSNYQSDMPQKRNSTARRSAQAGFPTFQRSGEIPTSAKLNTLSSQIGLNANETNETSSLNPNNWVLKFAREPNNLILLLRICVRHISSRDSEMSVIQVGILSGFKPNEADLAEVIKDPGTPAMKYELSADKTLVVIYMRYIPSSGPYCMQFRLVRETAVHNLQSRYIRAYEYYNPTHSCSNFYTPTRVTDLIDTKCDGAGQVCQCAAKSMCPATRKLLELAEIHANNATTARDRMVDLICSNQFDLVSLVRPVNVRHFETAKTFKLSVKVKSDLRGNLTKIIEAQRQQARQSSNIRKPQRQLTTEVLVDSEEETSLDHLSLSIDSACIKNDQLLLHLAHPGQLKQGGELMILFGRSENLEKRFFMTTQQKSHSYSSSQSSNSYPKPKPAILSGLTAASANLGANSNDNLFDDAQQLQYSTTMILDKNSILHDITYQESQGVREAINNLVRWIELRSRREKWSCPSH